MLKNSQRKICGVKIINEAVKYQKFLAMLDQELTEGNVSNTLELSKIFPPMTVIGLTANQYYIDGEDSRSEPNTPKPEKITPKAAPVTPEITPEETEFDTEENPLEEDIILTARTPVKPKKPSAKEFSDELVKSAMNTGLGHDVMDLLNIFSHFEILTIDQAIEFSVYLIAQIRPIDIAGLLSPIRVCYRQPLTGI